MGAHALNSPLLEIHPFFRKMVEVLDVMMLRICSNASSTEEFAQNDKAFYDGDEARNMFFVKTGSFQYRRQSKSVGPALRKFKAWLSEAALWTTWRHRGDLEAREPSELMLLSPGEFGCIMSIHPQPWLFSQIYGIFFVTFLNEVEPEHVSDVMFDDSFFEKALDFNINELDVQSFLDQAAGPSTGSILSRSMTIGSLNRVERAAPMTEQQSVASDHPTVIERLVRTSTSGVEIPAGRNSFRSSPGSRALD